MHQKEKKKERRRRYELGLFCSVCHCRFTLLGMGSFRCMAWKTPGSGIYLYLPGTGCLFQFHCRYVDFFGTSSDADNGRDPSGVFVLPLAGIITYGRWKYKWILGFSTILSLVFVCINIFKPEIHNKTLMPALQSPWFTPHVIVYMFAYAMLGAATVMAVYLLWFKKKGIERHEMALCDNLTYVGLAFMTLGMLGDTIGHGTLKRLGRRLPGFPIWHISISVWGVPRHIARHWSACLYLFCCCKCAGTASIICPRHKE